ncbi:MAG: oligosaccharide flippase family protein [Deltaproteobacteria bacterium]|nr:oligosaccharide flippase family protein [Deltaproteobacteria bacterium]
MLSMQILGRAIRFGYLVVIARLLTPEDVGIFTYGIAFYLALLGLAQVGQNAVLSTRLGRKRRGVEELLAHSLSVRLVVTTTVMLLAGAAIWLTEADRTTRWVVLFFLLALSARSLVLWVRHTYVGLERATWIPRYEVTFRGLEALVGSGALLLGAGLLEVCALHTVVWTLEATFCIRRLRLLEAYRPRLGFDRRFLRKLIGLSAFFTLNFWLIDLYLQAGVVTMKYIQPDTATVGFYGVAWQFSITLLVLPFALAEGILPGLSRAWRMRDASRLGDLPLAIKLALLAGAVAATLATAYAPFFIDALFGPRYAKIAETFVWLCWSVGPYAVTLLASQGLNAANAWRHAVVVTAAPVAVHLILMVALVPDYGLAGAAASAVAGAVAGSLVGCLLLGRRLPVMRTGSWLVPLLLLGVAGAVMLHPATPRDLAGAVVTVLLLVAFRYLGVFDPAERARIGEIIARRSRAP